tara:strand:+ start:664 stop:813 length:150 start_codon:yes stop_codon:yes gene_type:complete
MASFKVIRKFDQGKDNFTARTQSADKDNRAAKRLAKAIARQKGRQKNRK